MGFLEHALWLAKQGFHVFPLIPNSKLPAIEDFPHLASCDPAQIKKWWVDPILGWEQPYNIGISTTKFSQNQALLVVDVDNKGAKKGSEEIEKLKKENLEVPQTFTQKTPSGGLHFVYVVKEPIKQGTSVLAPGLDIRGRGGYIVGAGSEIDGKRYEVYGEVKFKAAPKWMVDKCGKAPEKTQTSKLTPITNINAKNALARAIFYLENEAPLAREGDGGDQTTFLVAARVKDFGIYEKECLDLMLTFWNDRCEPSWGLSELKEKVKNAYRYGDKPVGILAPEAHFTTEVIDEKNNRKHFIQTINEEFALVTLGGGVNILRETSDECGNRSTRFMNVESFHQLMAPKKVRVGDGAMKQQSVLWMHSQDRRGYDGVCFLPGREAPKRFYNLWRGFSVTPFGANEKPNSEALKSVEMFKDHAFKNVCAEDNSLYTWLTGYFAHLIQRPWEKPHTALVFRGNKGVGKNALLNCVGKLLGGSFVVTSNKRYLTGNFNSHLENLLMLALDEAFWSGDKQAEGVLKDLITGGEHIIERKGKEPYTVKNCTRVVIIGNEDWLVPASADERRFAVFEVGEGNKQDTQFFERMRKGMEAGGDRLLFQYLKNFDLSQVNVNVAPQTEALLEQKISTLNPIEQFWFECLTEGYIVGGSEFENNWPAKVSKEAVRNAFKRYVQDRQIKSRIPEDHIFSKMLKRFVPSLDANQKITEGERRLRVYTLPTLEECRRSWDQRMGHKGRWGLH